MAPNPTNMQIFGKQKLCTTNHTCNQQVECKIIPQETQKNTQNSYILGNVSFFLKATQMSTLKWNLKEPMMV